MKWVYSYNPGAHTGPLLIRHARFAAATTSHSLTNSLKALKGKCRIWVNKARLQSSGSMPDCSSRGPGIESRHGQLCLSDFYRKNRCDLQPWARAMCTLPAVPRSTQPSALRGTVNEYQLSGWVIKISPVGDWRSTSLEWRFSILDPWIESDIPLSITHQPLPT